GARGLEGAAENVLADHVGAQPVLQRRRRPARARSARPALSPQPQEHASSGSGEQQDDRQRDHADAIAAQLSPAPSCAGCIHVEMILGSTRRYSASLSSTMPTKATALRLTTALST